MRVEDRAEPGKEAEFNRFVVRMIAWNGAVSALLAIILYVAWGAGVAYGVLFGAGISTVNMLLLGGRLSNLPTELTRARGRIVGGIIQRFVFTLLAFAIGFKYLGLSLPGLVAGLLASHFLFFILAVRSGSVLRR